VHALAGKRGPAALAAGGIRVGEGADAAAHEHGGEIRHGKVFEFRRRSPASLKKARN
jgi:hypothetical protein